MSAVQTDQILEVDFAAPAHRPVARTETTTAPHDAAIRLAGDVQRSLLPTATPTAKSVSLQAVYLPAGHVSGDVYTYHEIAGKQISLSIADVTGHGLAAAMMATYILRALGASCSDESAATPTDRLHALNGELVGTACPHAPFAAALFATYDEKLQRVEWARGGVPYPIHVRPGQPAVQLRTAGCILGAFDEVSLQSRYLTLQPGHSVIFHTDGLDALLLHEAGTRVHDCISQSDWFASLGERSIAESLTAIEAHRAAAGERGWPVDDVTVLALTRRY